MDFYDLQNPKGAHADVHTSDWWNGSETLSVNVMDRDGSDWSGSAEAWLDEENLLEAQVSGRFDGPDPDDVVIDDVHSFKIL